MQSSRASFTYSTDAMIEQQLPWIGSISMAAIVLPWRLKTSSSRWKLFIGVMWASAFSVCGIPFP